mmetsp:Transcript_17593/g.31030  ORF Transcript_17593/g.31030 Transcript_17593/m.31030 type:complete len:551 (-) Transcript_17593:84-1736(-)|eukprot:CAMPEP_0201869228 /NCGR_PEP_ID=MMETSP0902-20130614/2816_1 /ASSEMBLY_ACC=CAM_ASM_000551 /TAXON_ID=420261 /ORGANISM="Thalassiosira antarctica, Strain CCMP982" /LENGTH=550 /DNA_ID=CAMNT_0048394697 /DNA_START=122 /DNA_END=1774 /DNA_ORIENTATION=+
MKLSIALLVTTLAAAEASGSSKWANLRRRLSFEKVAGYMPGSQVTDHCAIDLDQKAMEAQISLKTPESFENARRIYNEGGNSKSYAMLTLTVPLKTAIKKGDLIVGKNQEGNEVAGKAYANYDMSTSTIKVQYMTTDLQDSYVQCQVGALVETNTKGCFVGEMGDLKIDGAEYAYTYNAAEDNRGGRTIAGFSEDDNAKDKMRVGCKGCPYEDFQYFYDYYGKDDYAHHWIEAAFAGEKTQFTYGNADFSRYTLEGKGEVIKKGTAYLNIFMYVIRELEDALDDCERDCINCNDAPVHAWDEAVCFYTGSIEGVDGATDDGKLLHQLADKRCANYKTCGVEGTDLAGMAKLNYDLFNLFAVGNFQLSTGNCPAARRTTKEIITKLYVPMIQGTMRYAYKADKLSGGEKEKAEGAVFAAAVLPRVHAVSPTAAKTIYDNMKVDASSTDFKAVKAAFESVYAEVGISCTDIGGLWNEGTNMYYSGMEPCAETISTMNSEVETKNNNTLAVALGCTFGALFAIAAAMVVYMRSREKQGTPVFKTSETDVKDMN